ncbi:hypothetical protein RIF29_01960 [Crotalaria pallida]|uniref:Replication factor A C-terminal domain-containing protein n=1 Tax=Crotalaria pallida TaxID=3830 RepID=A0AAN9P7Q2_CROPI
MHARVNRVWKPLLPGNVVKYMHCVLIDAQAGKFATKAKINYVIEDNNWYFNACASCKTKLIDKQKEYGTGTYLYCDDKCKKPPTLVIPKYKIQFMVSDATEETIFTLFDSLAFKFFHKTAMEMLHELEQIGDPFGFPPVLYTFCDKEYAFLVDVTYEFNILRKRESFTILQMTDDEDILKAFHENNTAYEELASMSGENDPSAFKTPDSATQKNRSFIATQDDSYGLSQLPTPQLSTTKVIGKMKQKKQD